MRIEQLETRCEEDLADADELGAAVDTAQGREGDR
jgi:hypothetical protein